MCTRLLRLLKTSLNINSAVNTETKKLCSPSVLFPPPQQCRHLLSLREFLFQHPLSFLPPLPSPKRSSSHPCCSPVCLDDRQHVQHFHWLTSQGMRASSLARGYLRLGNTQSLHTCLFVRAPIHTSFPYSIPLFHRTSRNLIPLRCQAEKGFMISYCLETGVEVGRITVFRYILSCYKNK